MVVKTLRIRDLAEADTRLSISHSALRGLAAPQRLFGDCGAPPRADRARPRRQWGWQAVARPRRQASDTSDTSDTSDKLTGSKCVSRVTTRSAAESVQYKHTCMHS